MNTYDADFSSKVDCNDRIGGIPSSARRVSTCRLTVSYSPFVTVVILLCRSVRLNEQISGISIPRVKCLILSQNRGFEHIGLVGFRIRSIKAGVRDQISTLSRSSLTSRSWSNRVARSLSSQFFCALTSSSVEFRCTSRNATATHQWKGSDVMDGLSLAHLVQFFMC